MMWIPLILLWISIIAILFSYILYPIIIKILALKKSTNKTIYPHIEKDLPFVSILISAYNEEKVIKEKIESIIKSNYPKDKLEVLIGSDASTDNTNELLKQHADKYPMLQCFIFDERQGKGNVINILYAKAKGEILIITDANVLFSELTIFELVKHYKNPKIGLVDSLIINTGLNKSGISIQEKTYLSREATIKNYEGKIWGTMMGPFGGCYSVRKNLYEKIPPNYLVDDFYINMIVLQKGYEAINELNAIVYEDVSNNPLIEFKRKIRIATGNFQNLAHFKKLLWPVYKGLGFSFLSHKVLRWLGPFFLICILLCSALLIKNHIYLYLFYIICCVLIFTIIDFFLRLIGIHILLLRFISHFLSMNFALFIGYIRFLKGVNTNVWQPTKRNQIQP